MNIKMTSLLLIATVFVGMNTQTVFAKDIFYYIGYGMVQVVDGDTDAIVADIPVDGWIRASPIQRRQEVSLCDRQKTSHTQDRPC